MLHTVKKAEYLNGYKIKLYFDNRKIKIVNLENMLRKAKNMLLPLTKLDYFKQVQCDGITIYWPNGVDLCPDMLYKMGEELTPSPRKRQNDRLTYTSKKRRAKSVNKA
jgi:hypothetical protein